MLLLLKVPFQLLDEDLVPVHVSLETNRDIFVDVEIQVLAGFGLMIPSEPFHGDWQNVW